MVRKHPNPLGSVLSTNFSVVSDFILILEKHRKNCELQGKYVEAGIALGRLEKLRVHGRHLQEECLHSQQIAQRLGVDEAHMLEFQQLKELWEYKINEYENRASELLDAMRQRHGYELCEVRRKFTLEPMRKPKKSKELLQLRTIERALAKRGEYAEAQLVKAKSDGLEAAELTRMEAERGQLVSKMEVKWLHRQGQELAALRQRIQAGAEEQRKARQLDLERLLQRYHNVKGALVSQQNLVRVSMRMGQTVGCGARRGGVLRENVSHELNRRWPR